MSAMQPDPYAYHDPRQPFPQTGATPGYQSAPAPVADQEPTFVDPYAAGYEPYPVHPQQYEQQVVQPYVAPYPAYQPYAAPLPVEDPGRSLGIAGLVVALTLWWVPYLGFLAPIVAMTLSIMGYQRSKAVGLSNSPAVAGMIVAGLSMVLGLLGIVALVIFMAAA